MTGQADTLREGLISGAPSTIKYDVPKPREVLADDASIVVEPLDITEDSVRVIPVDEMFAR